MPVISAKRTALLFLSASVLALAACGGGGGGGGTSTPTTTSPPPPSPPPPANAAPAIVTAVGNSTPDEGQTFTLDASGTSDPESDPLTFSWAQLSGPAVDIPDTSMEVLAELRVPELNETSVATFEVTVSDGTNESKQSLDITLTDIHQEPRFDAEPALLDTLSFDDPVEAVFVDNRISFSMSGANTAFVATELPTGEKLRIQQLGLSPADELGIVNPASILEDPTKPASFASAHVMGASQYYWSSFAVLEEATNRLKVFVQYDAEETLENVLSLPVKSPCASYRITKPFNNWNGPMLIGSREGGFSLIDTNNGYQGSPPEVPLYRTFGTVESFCAIYAAENPLQGQTYNSYDPTMITLPDVVALNSDTNEIYHYKQSVYADPYTSEYGAPEITELDLQTSESLQLVASTRIGRFSDFGTGMALVFTDGKHNGTHRLVIIGTNVNRVIIQGTYNWSKGVPADVLLDDLNGDNFPEIVVITETSPDAVVFTAQPDAAIIPPEPNGQWGFLPLLGPSYIDIGLGAVSAVPSIRNALGPDLLLITDKEGKEIRAYATGN